MRDYKRVNIGDGFILTAIRNLLSPHKCQFIFSTRRGLSEAEIRKINSTKALILAGANQLNDSYSVVPGMTKSELNRIQVPIIPFGIGIHGEPDMNKGMSQNTMDILREIHRRIKFSSWRCPMSVKYLSEHLPEIQEKFLMTSCPVVYGPRLLQREPFKDDFNKVIVTVTDREDFTERERTTIDFVHREFKSYPKFLSLHQFYEPRYGILPSRKQRTRPTLNLEAYAKSLGFKLFKPKKVDTFLAFYRDRSFHVGSRLHAHLYCLSQSQKTFLTYVDERCVGFSQSLNFPVCDYRRLSEYLSYNFEDVRESCIDRYQVMTKFINYVKEDILG